MVDTIVESIITTHIESLLLEQGFKRRGKKNDFVRRIGDCHQELGTLFHKTRGTDAGDLEVYPGFLFSRIENLASELEGVPRRPGWLTVTANLGNLMPQKRYLKWPIMADTDPDSIGRLVVQYIRDHAFPFWDDFSTLEGLVQGFEKDDPRLHRPRSTHRWRFAAAYCLLGNWDGARAVLANWAEGRPNDKVLEAAVSRIAERARR